MADPSVIAAVLAALEAAPENDALRLHLASLLLASDAGASLQHCAVVLGRKPDDADALQLAARAAEALGDDERAESYRRLHRALSSTGERPPAKTGDDEESEDREASVQPARRGLRLVQGGGEESDQASPWQVEKETVTLADVAGMEAVKKRLRIAFLEPMKNPKMMKAYGMSLRG